MIVKARINDAIFGNHRTILRGEVRCTESLPHNLDCCVKSNKKQLTSTLYLEESSDLTVSVEGLFVQAFSLSIESDPCALNITFSSSLSGDTFNLAISEGRVWGYFYAWVNLTHTSDAPRMYNNFISEKRCFDATGTPTIACSNSKTSFSLIVPLYHTPIDLFTEMTSSVLAQTYQNWQLILVNSTPEDDALKQAVEQLQSKDKRITVVTLNNNLGITGNTNIGMKSATGDFVCFFDHDDTIEPNTLEEYLKAIESDNDIDMLYCDEDVLFSNGTFGWPNYKSDFNIDQLRNNNYICHMLCIRKSIVDEIGPTPDGFDGAQDHWLTLRASEISRKVWHVRKILYHWRAAENSTALDPDSKLYATQAGIRAVQNHLDRIGLSGQVSEFGRPFTYKVSYPILGNPRVTFVLWNCKNEQHALEQIETIKENTDYSNYSFLCIFREPYHSNIADSSKSLSQDITFINLSHDDYFDTLNRLLTASESDYFVLMDRIIRPVESDWLTELLGFADRKGTGVVGPKINNIDCTTYQAGYAITPTGVHELFVNFPLEYLGYGGLNEIVRNVSAVPASCMVIKSDVFKRVGGFSNQYNSICWDADFCERAAQNGECIVYVSNVVLESTSFSHRMNTSGDQLSKAADKYSDQLTFMQTWKHEILKGDPFYSQNFDYDKSGPLYCSSNWLDKYEEKPVRSGMLKIAAKAYRKLKKEE